MSSSAHSSYACHRLIDEQGTVHGPSIVCIGKDSGSVLSCSSFNNEEVPFVQWIGGIIVIKGEPPQAWHTESVNKTDGEWRQLK